MMFWTIVIATVALVLAVSWKANRRRRAIRWSGNQLGNRAEQRFLEEDHPVTVHFGPGGAQTRRAPTRARAKAPANRRQQRRRWTRHLDDRAMVPNPPRFGASSHPQAHDAPPFS